MAAVVRVKRRLDENPSETLILNCKRRKINGDEGSEDISTLLTLAGTSQNDENIDTLLRKHRVSEVAELKKHFKKPKVNISDRIRTEMRESSKANRYKVVNCFRRTLDGEGGEESQEAASTSRSEVTVLDIETDRNQNESIDATIEGGDNDDELKYVYDFYYTSSDDLGQADIEAYYVSIYPSDDPLVFGSLKDNGLETFDSDDDSEDSNAESNWKNDYPDEEDLASVNEDDMIDAIKNMKIDEDLLSSDSGEEDLVYSKDEEDFQDVEDEVDREDELRYGKQYAKFKAKNKNVVSTGVGVDFYYGDIDEEEYYY